MKPCSFLIALLLVLLSVPVRAADAVAAAPPPAAALPALVKAGQPVYPFEARRRGQEGTAVVRIRITPEGTVSAAELARSSGHALLDAAALKAVPGFRFRIAAGATTDQVYHLPIVFSLEDTSVDADGYRLREPAHVPYPLLMRLLGQTGSVILKMKTDADGQATEVGVVRSSGVPRIDRSARQAAARLTFIRSPRDAAPASEWRFVRISYYSRAAARLLPAAP